MSIKNIIFDFGGVIYNIDYYKPVQLFKEMGIENFETLYSQAAQTSLMDDIETGKITPEEFRDGLRKIAGIPLSDEGINKAWNSILLNLPQENVELLGKVKLKYKTFLFSNTNQINEDCFRPMLEQELGFDMFTTLFNETFFSHRIQLRKPHPESFLYIINKHHLNPAETLFIDDTAQHIEGAKKAGLQALWLEKGMKIQDLFDIQGNLTYTFTS